MNISFFTPINDKGISTYSNRLADEIEKLDARIHVNKFGIKIRDSRRNRDIALYVADQIIFRLIGRGMNKGDIAHIQHEYQVFRGENPLFNMYKAFRRQISIPTIITVHELSDIRIGQNSETTGVKKIIRDTLYVILGTKRYLDYVNRKMFEECEAIIVHTNIAKKTLLKRGITKEKVHVIAHGIPAIKKSKSTKEQDKSKLGLADKYIIMTYGYVTRKKNQKLMIKAMKALNDDTIYIIAGSEGRSRDDIAYMQEIKDYIEKYNLQNRVIITGHIEEKDVASYMNAADICLYPAMSATASGVISEYIAYNKAILAANIPYVQEINTQNPCIETFEINNVTELVEKVQYLQEDAHTKEIVKQTKIYAKTHSYKEAAKKTIALYENLYGYFYETN